jgi:hypothetical protein
MENNISYLNNISQKYNIKINYIDLNSINNISNIMENFISACLIRKKYRVHKKRNSNKNCNINKENIDINKFTKSEGSTDIRDKSSSPRKLRKENCNIF